MLLDKSRELIVCDHCEYVSHCDLRGSEDPQCPHHYDLYTGATEIMTVEIAEETNKIVKVKTQEQEITVLLTEEDFRILEYGAYQLEMTLENYLKTVFRTEVREIKRKYGLA